MFNPIGSLGRMPNSTAESWLHTEYREEVWHGHHAGKPFGGAAAGQCEINAVHRGYFFERLILRLKIDEVGCGKGSMRKIRLRFPEPNQALGLGIRQGTN
jgi:hypothetical protein